MQSPASRPALRSVETLVVPDGRAGKVLVLRDTQGVAPKHVVVPMALVAILARFTGEATCAEIAAEVAAERGEPVEVALVTAFANDLDRALFLDSPRFREAWGRSQKDFEHAQARPASHAGGAYHGDPTELGQYIDERCFGVAAGTAARSAPRAVALVAPHIDPWRGALGYGHAYGALAGALAAEVDTFVVLGTSHAPMREPFALCRKAFDTPLGSMPVDGDAVDFLASRARFDAYADEYNHKREHSVEFQAVFLKHVLGPREARIVPVLAGLGDSQSTGVDPHGDRKARSMLDAIAELVASRPGRVMLVAGADLAHVGPRFGDRKALGAKGRHRLEATDRASLDHALAADRPGFWRHVARDLAERRVCGLAPIYALLHALPGGSDGELLHYEQTIDPDEGSIVSHAAMLFRERAVAPA